MLTARLQAPATPLTPCIDLTTAESYLRMDTGASSLEAALVTDLILSAMAWVEDFCKQPVFARDYYGYGVDFLDTTLHTLNLTAVSAVAYQVTGSTNWVALASTEYSFWETGEVFFTTTAKMIPNVTRIRVSYTAGYAPNALPANIQQVVRLLLAKWYDSRADEKREVPGAAEWLLSGHQMALL